MPLSDREIAARRLTATRLMVWDYTVTEDLAPWDYDGGEAEFADFVIETGWDKPVQANLEEYVGAFAKWYLATT